MRKVLLLSWVLTLGIARADEPDAFRRVKRDGSVDIEQAYDLSGLSIPREEIHELLPRDAIPSLTDPKLEDAAQADWLADDARVIEVSVGGEAVAAPLSILTFHEAFNLTVGGRPLAAVYCPLCDSASVVSRQVTLGGEERVLEFGISGALFNSNVLLYDRETRGLWSQLGMRAVSGPLLGTTLEHLPARVITFGQFKTLHPLSGRVVSQETGHRRPYGRNPYARFWSSDELRVPVRGVDPRLPKKTRGLGVEVGGETWFIPEAVIEGDYRLETPGGVVVVARGEAGLQVLEAPRSVSTLQTFYYAWSAFYPQTTIAEPAAAQPARRYF